MKTERLRVAVVYGGRSGEHEVSIESARSVIQAIDPDRYDVVPVGITQDGAWLAAPPEVLLGSTVSRPDDSNNGMSPGQLVALAEPTRPVRRLSDVCDVAFPLVHGTYGEDGCLQGFFELASIPYVGAPVLASAVGMDKILMKMVFRAAELPLTDYAPLERADWERDRAGTLTLLENQIGYPCFVKPANLGSSVGISKVRNRAGLAEALGLAAEFSARILVERGVDVRELECAILGNQQPMASVVGEVLPSREFYDYEAKYHDPSTTFVIPADIDEAVSVEIRDLAVKAFKAIGAAGMARVDFFLGRGDGRVYVNEINTIPGFTSMSVYPRLWQASGVSYPALIDRLIQLGLDRHADEARNRTQYERPPSQET